MRLNGKRRASSVVKSSDRPASDVVLKRFEKPDEARMFEKSKFEVIHLGGVTIQRATCEPGWRWS